MLKNLFLNVYKNILYTNKIISNINAILKAKLATVLMIFTETPIATIANTILKSKSISIFKPPIL
ncbi:Conserved hypothetical protein [Clostridioides difficile]|uniref:Uncharacterized protein n=2 Tax=Clostridioides difficile TaxID=1496 RepID=F3Y5U8_CLOD6|nr:conserved hypothetical protein [Clostridioides difficile 630]CCL11965.1 Conserved hypothetical protein [Clostridioides difficile E16]CCL14392.1 Conserved hypothetical protein [Clostridioides difficile T22]CCL22419.1 Conserved hypothetical protein [Clostridioides difficile T15]CCL41189.1 Conserved hypothetical protein [Clostridioides difficile E24]CCL44931.1 Conserved hypothetical protein [Clostridioides difficile T42]CCL49503.1 Conserved hypothetical protein [Clostridioides difficile T6]C